MSRHLWSVRHVMLNELAPDCGDGHEVRVGTVAVRVDGDRNVSGRAQKSAVFSLPGYADAVRVVGGQVPQIPSVGDAPIGVLHIVAVTVVGSVLSRLTWKVDLDLTEGAEFGPPHVCQRQTKGYLISATTPKSTTHDFLCGSSNFSKTSPGEIVSFCQIFCGLFCNQGHSRHVLGCYFYFGRC